MGRGFSALLVALSSIAPVTAAAADAGSAKPASQPASDQPLTRTLPGGAVLRMAPGTRLALGRPMKVQLGSPPRRTLAQSVQLLSGRVEVDLPETKHPTTAVLIQAPAKISAVAMGGHSVVIANGNRVTVGAISGEMLAASGNEWRTLPTHIVREYAPGAAMSDHAVLPAPTTALSAPIALKLRGRRASAPLKARASAVTRAASYEFSVWRLQGAARTLLSRSQTNDGALNLRELEPGSYGVSSHAIEASGLEGAESELVPLRVVEAELPDGARLGDDGILLPPNQRVRLLGTDGIEVSYGRAPQFIPAPTTIGLIRGEPTLVRLRAAGSTAELSLTLSPRTVHADVMVGPARARWPRDAVQITVRLSDSRGRPLADDVVVKPSASVDVTPVAVDWKREHGLLTGSISPQPGAGPWVVRVEVQDDSGAVVGRNFLEIANSPALVSKR